MAKKIEPKKKKQGDFDRLVKAMLTVPPMPKIKPKPKKK